MSVYLVSNSADEQAALNAGIPPSQIEQVGTTTAGYSAPTRLNLYGGQADVVYVGQAARFAPAGAKTLVGATRTQTQQLLSQDFASGGATNSSGQLSAKALITNLLAPLGLESLADWAWNAYNQSGGSMDYVNAQLPQQKAFQDRFPEYAALAGTGDAMTPAQIVAAEQQVGQLFEQYGIAGMPGYDPRTATAQLLMGHVSMSELDARLQARQQAAAQYHPDVANQLSTLFGIQGDKALTAYATDPKNALAMLQQQVLASQDAAKANTTGFGQLSRDQATQLAQWGVTPEQAQSGFTQLGVLGQLRHALPGENGGGVSADQMIGAQFGGNGQDILALQAEQQRRLAAFQNKGGYAGTQQGLTGVGPANPI